jgi:hypothetical protein
VRVSEIYLMCQNREEVERIVVIELEVREIVV